MKEELNDKCKTIENNEILIQELLTNKQENLEPRRREDFSKNEIEHLNNIIKEKEEQINKYKNRLNRIELIFEKLLKNMNENLTDKINKKMEDKFEEINKYYETIIEEYE